MNTKRMYDLLLELARIPSVSPSSEEKRIAETIYNALDSEPYFQTNPEQLRLLPIEGDRLGRQSVYAMVRAKPRTSKTIIMIGHLDVVETREARDLAELAYHPEEYTRRLHERMLPQSARRDLESGDFLFGRGVFDMKCGVAAEVELMRKASLNPGSLQRNLMMLIVGDEENQSAGMLSAVEHLVRIQEDEDLEFVVCVNTEGETQKYAGDTNRYVSLGTIGKMMPVFYCVGRESHVGSHYEGLNANLLASAVNMVLEGSPEWADKVGSEVYPPPTALKHRDLRDVYSVTLPARAVTYFNYLFVNKTPGVALEMMKTVAREAFDMALERMRYSAERFSAKGDSVVEIRWQPKVITYNELVESVRESFDSASQNPSALQEAAASSDPGTSHNSGRTASQEAGELLESTALLDPTAMEPTASLDPTASPGLTSSVGVTASRDPVTTPDLTASQASTAPSSAFDLHIRSFTDALPSDMDDRDKSISIMGEVLRHYEDKEPVIIVGFLPPFYPHRTNLRESSRELGIVRAVEELVSEAKESYGETLKVNEHFVAISDLSYVGFHGTREDILPLTENTPGWGRVYNLPVEALLKLNTPVLNIGPSGRDAHNFTERLHLPYYLGAYPNLLESLIERLSLIP